MQQYPVQYPVQPAARPRKKGSGNSKTIIVVSIAVVGGLLGVLVAWAVWRAGDATPYGVVIDDDGAPVVATGRRGRIVTIGPHGDVARELAFPANAASVIVRDEAAFMAAYPGVDAAIIAGQYVGSLDNRGERVKMDDATGSTIMDFNYRDGDPWPARAVGSRAGRRCRA